MYSRLVFFALLLALNPAEAQDCPPPGDRLSLAYMSRDNNRCEGIKPRDVSTSAPSLISFSTSSLNNTYPNTLSIRVPGTGNNSPTITIQSFEKNYRLDNLQTLASKSGFTFLLDTKVVLQKAGISLRSLYATAFITRNSSDIYFPVILGQPSSKYKFVVNSPQRTTFPILEIRRSGKVIFSNPRNISQRGHIRFAWEYGKAPAGTYEILMVNGQEQRRTFTFEHNPKWFK